ncbi:universal stress protein [bacterium]|nr:universal stress protein [bacterium]
MMTINKILYPTDFSDHSHRALRHALFLARQYKATLHILHAVVLHGEDPYNPELHFPALDEVEKELEKKASERMLHMIQNSSVKDVSIVRAQERGVSPAPVILEYAVKNDIDLVVIGTHGRRGLRHLLMGSVAEEVVRMAPCPVMTVRHNGHVSETVKMDTIVVPVDFSEHSLKALSRAKEMAAVYDSRLQVLYVFDFPNYPAFYQSVENIVFDSIKRIENKSIDELKKFYAGAEGSDVKAEFHVLDGRASHEIVEFASKQHADLIVMATHGLTGLQHLLIGSVAEKVVRSAECPVLTIKSFR